MPAFGRVELAVAKSSPSTIYASVFQNNGEIYRSTDGGHTFTLRNTGSGLLGAPKVGDKADWGKRAKEQGGIDGLLAKAISGINAMPPKGTCADCSDDELKAAIHHMSGL